MNSHFENSQNSQECSKFKNKNKNNPSIVYDFHLSTREKITPNCASHSAYANELK
jgi:hypothetical protein